MRYIGNQIRLQPFTFYLFLKRLFQTGSDAVNHFSHLELLAGKPLQIHLIRRISACNFCNGIGNSVMLSGNAEQLVKDQVIQNTKSCKKKQESGFCSRINTEVKGCGHQSQKE